MDERTELAKLAVEAQRSRRLEVGRYGLQTPSGNVIGMGREKPLLSVQDKRDYWKVLRFRPQKRKAKP